MLEGFTNLFSEWPLWWKILYPFSLVFGMIFLRSWIRSRRNLPMILATVLLLIALIFTFGLIRNLL